MKIVINDNHPEYEVITVSNLKEFNRIIDSKYFNLILIDHQLGETTGLQCIRKCK